LANIVRLYRGEAVERAQGSGALLKEIGLDNGYTDVPGLCKVIASTEIEAQGWSLNPGRYVGTAAREVDSLDFTARLETLAEELEALNTDARELEGTISAHVGHLLSRGTG